MSNRASDEVWSVVAVELRQSRKLQPLGLDEIDTELGSTGADDLSEEQVAKIRAFATSKDSAPVARGRHVELDASAARVLQEVSSAGLVSTEQIRALETERIEAAPRRTPSDVLLELARRNLLPTHEPKRVEKGLEKGVLLDDYLLLDTVGVGGMGEVFRALHLRMDRVVAVKVVASKASRLSINQRRFETEVKALAKLNHPNILTAYHSDESGGVPYLVMEYIDGSDLGRLVYQLGPLTPSLAVNYVLQAARGLDYAHRQGIIHRDVKPSNMLVDSDGVVKISDLGLAKFIVLGDQVDRGHDSTDPGTAVGTFAYMSPEQAAGSDEVDARSDVYGLGCTLFYLLLGRSPVEGATHEAKLRWHCEGAIPSLRTQLPKLPKRLDAIFQSMLAKSPADRPQSMTDVIRELEACQEILGATFPAGAEADADTIEWPEKPDAHAKPAPQAAPSKRRTRFRWVAALALLALLPIGLLAYAYVDIWRRDFLHKPPADFTNSVGMHLTGIPAGEFKMGAPIGEPGSLVKERPQRNVRITQPFHIGTFEVTQRQYYLVMDPKKLDAIKHVPRPDEPPAVDPDALPMVNVTWNDAIEYCRRLSSLPEEKRHGRTYRLPTEAEWEYCCRAGTRTAYSMGDSITFGQSNVGAQWRPPNTKFPGSPRLLEVGGFAPNPFGLYDMHGNALEWCKDRYGEYHPEDVKDPQGPKAGQQRVVRGGATTYNKLECRSAYRRYKHPHETNRFTGFRVVCEMKTK